MIRNKKSLWLAIIGLLVCISIMFIPLTACQPTSTQPQSAIKIGLLYPLTGPLAVTGDRMVKAAQFAFEEAGYEVAGRKIEVISEDTAGSPDTAVDKAKKLVELDKACMVIGTLTGGERLSVGAYAAKVQLPHLATHPSPIALTEHQWSFLVGGAFSQAPSAMGAYAYDTLKYKTVTVMSEDSVSGHGLVQPFIDSFKKKGGQVVQEQYAPFPCADFAPYLSVLKDADALVAWYHGPDTVLFLKQIDEFGVRQKMPLVASFMGSFFAPWIFPTLPPSSSQAIIGELCPAPYTNLLDIKTNKQFVEAFQKKYSNSPDDADAGAYTGAKVALETLKATKGDISPAKIKEALLSLKMDTVEGPLRFDPGTRCVIKNQYICQVEKQGDKWMLVPIYTYKDVPPNGL